MRQPLEPGSVIADYRVESLLGEGATGAVYLARDARGDAVALKLLAPELARDERFRARFLRESRLVAGLEHPRVVTVLASGGRRLPLPRHAAGRGCGPPRTPAP